ncbi:MAG: hypothetical protein AAF438_10870, partial [Pseudomonadota bacterium]
MFRPIRMVVVCFALTATLACHPHKSLVSDRGEDKDNWWDKLPRPAWAQFERLQPQRPWFEIYSVAPGVIAIYEPGQF